MKGKWNWFQKLGFLMILISVLLLLGSELLAARNREQTEALVQQLEAILPENGQGLPEDYSDPHMPVLQLEGEDFCGLLEIPSYGVSLPVGGEWEAGSVSVYPRRFWGSIYDRSMVIGGSGRNGQFDFCAKLDLGDTLRFTDMEGTRFSYEAVRIDRRKQVDAEELLQMQWDLTLFSYEETSGSYIVVGFTLTP